MPALDAVVRAAAVAATHHGAATVAELVNAGVGYDDVRRLVRSGVLVDAAPGVVTFAAIAPTSRQRLWVVTHAGRGAAIAAFETAAWLHGLDGFARAPRILDVITPRGRRLHGIDHVARHDGPLDPAELVTVEDIPCTGLARTTCDIAHRFGADAALRALDDLERRGISLQWVSVTAARLRRPRYGGSRVIERLLAERTGHVPDSWFERLVERCISLPRLPPWTRQHAVVDDSGRFLARVDLACVDLRLAVEAHSRRFHFGAVSQANDQDRENDLGEHGWYVRYLTWRDATRTPDDVASGIERLARRRAHDLAIALPGEP